MTPEDVQDLFTNSDIQYRFARWARPVVPIVFGVEDETLSVVKGAIEAVVSLAGHEIAETDPELGANLMVFFLREWSELADVPDLDRLIPELPDVLKRLEAADANQYRLFRFEDSGAIKASFVFLRMDATMAQLAAEDLALSQMVQIIFRWGDQAFSKTSPLARLPDSATTVLRPEIAALIRAGYDPVMPVAANDPAHALRMFARLGTVE